MIKVLECLVNKTEFPETRAGTDIPITVSKNVEITKTSRSGNILIINSRDKQAWLLNPYLINAIIKCPYWHKLL